MGTTSKVHMDGVGVHIKVLNWRQRGQVVRLPDMKFGGKAGYSFKSGSDH